MQDSVVAEQVDERAYLLELVKLLEEGLAREGLTPQQLLQLRQLLQSTISRLRNLGVDASEFRKSD